MTTTILNTQLPIRGTAWYVPNKVMALHVTADDLGLEELPPDIRLIVEGVTRELPPDELTTDRAVWLVSYVLTRDWTGPVGVRIVAGAGVDEVVLVAGHAHQMTTS